VVIDSLDGGKAKDSHGLGRAAQQHEENYQSPQENCEESNARQPEKIFFPFGIHEENQGRMSAAT